MYIIKYKLPLQRIIMLYCVSPVVSVLFGGEAAGQHTAHCLLSAVNVILQVLSLRQLPRELTFLLLQRELEGSKRVTGMH